MLNIIFTIVCSHCLLSVGHNLIIIQCSSINSRPLIVSNNVYTNKINNHEFYMGNTDSL